MATRYPIRAVARLTGIPTETLRAWERRYGAVEPERSGRGRQYGEAEIRRLTRLNQLVQSGHAIGTIATLPDDRLDALLTGPGIPGPSGTVVRSAQQLLKPVITAIEEFDETRAGDELRRLSAMLSPHDFLYEAVVPLMREVGRRWHEGKLSIAQEHLTSQLLRSQLGGMRRSLRPSIRTRKMVFATPAGEAHEFGILAAAILAAIEGIEPVYLGADLPADELARAADRTRAHAVVLGITIARDHTMAEVRAIASALPPGVHLWAGGAGVAELDLSTAGRPVAAFTDLSAFELECRHWRP